MLTPNHYHCDPAAYAYLLGIQACIDLPPRPEGESRARRPDGRVKIPELGRPIDLSKVDVGVFESTVVELEAFEELLGFEANASHPRFIYLLQRAYLAYLQMWPTYGASMHDATVEQGNLCAMARKVRVAINADGIWLLDPRDYKLVASFRMADILKLTARDSLGGAPGTLTFNVNGSNIDLTLKNASYVSQVVAYNAFYVVANGAFPFGTSAADTEDKVGSNDQLKMMRQFIHDYSTLPHPPVPPSFEKDESWFQTPGATRVSAKEAVERLKVEREKAAVAAGVANKQREEWRKQQEDKLAKGDEDDGEGEKKKPKRAWPTPRAVVEGTDGPRTKHKIYAAVCGVPQHATKIKVPLVAHQGAGRRRRQTSAGARARKLGGEGEGAPAAAQPPPPLKPLTVPAALIPRAASPGPRSVHSVESEVPASWWKDVDPVFEVKNHAYNDDGYYYDGPNARTEDGELREWVTEDWVPLVGGRRRKRPHEPAAWDAKWQTRVLKKNARVLRDVDASWPRGVKSEVEGMR